MAEAREDVLAFRYQREHHAIEVIGNPDLRGHNFLTTRSFVIGDTPSS